MPDFNKSNFSQNSEVKARVKKAITNGITPAKAEFISASYRVLNEGGPAEKLNHFMILNNKNSPTSQHYQPNLLIAVRDPIACLTFSNNEVIETSGNKKLDVQRVRIG